MKKYNQTDIDGNNALILACKNKKKLKCFKMLTFHNINYNQINNDGDTALIWVCKNKMTFIALNLLCFDDIN